MVRLHSRFLWVLATIVILLIAGGVLRSGLMRVPGYLVHAAPGISVRVAAENSPVKLGDFRIGFSSVIDPALPAVVNISSTKTVKQQPIPNILQYPFLRQFFGGQVGPQQQRPEFEREHSLGSGVIVNPDGYILTNNHVISGASDIEVFTQSRNKYRAKLVGADPRTDVAVIKIDASGLRACRLPILPSSRSEISSSQLAIPLASGKRQPWVSLVRRDVVWEERSNITKTSSRPTHRSTRATREAH